MLLDAEGRFDRPLSSGPFSDEHPLWGPAGSGVLFVRRPLDAGNPQVWFLPEGETARFTGLAVSNVRQRNGRYGYEGCSTGAGTGLRRSRTASWVRIASSMRRHI